MKHPEKLSAIGSALLAGAVMSIVTSMPVSAAGIKLSVGSASAAPGSSMQSFDVDLTNSGPSTLAIGGFNFDLSVRDTEISLTDVTPSTAASYIFSSNSLFGPDLSGPNSGQSVLASDVVLMPFTGTTVLSGGTVGLGHVFFNVAADATPGVFALELTDFPSTSISDSRGNTLSVSSLSPGAITITAAIPEPSSFTLLLLPAAGVMLGRFGWKIRQGRSIFREDSSSTTSERELI